MLSNNKVTERLLIAMLGTNFVLLFFVALHVATAGHDATGQKAPDKVQDYRERLASVAARGGGGSSRAVWATCSQKSINRQPYQGT